MEVFFSSNNPIDNRLLVLIYSIAIGEGDNSNFIFRGEDKDFTHVWNGSYKNNFIDEHF